MSKSETMSMDTGKAGEPAVLTDKELDAVSGGMDLKGAGEALTQRAAQNGQNDPAQMFQQIMQQLTQGQG